MPTQVYEDIIHLDTEILEAVPLTARSASYPFPSLAPTGRRHGVEFRALFIENDLLRVTVIPALGGRILRILDKRTKTEILGASDTLSLEKGGPRGAFSRDGIRWTSERARLNDLGPVDYQIVDHPDEDSPGGIWLGELVGGKPLSVLVGLSLEPCSAELKVEMRTFNRSLGWVEASPRLQIPCGSWDRISMAHGEATYDRGLDRGLVVEFDRGEVRRCRRLGGLLEIGRFSGSGTLGPRQLDSWSASLVPVPGLGGLTAGSKDVACFFAEGPGGFELRIQSSRRWPSLKAVLLTSDGKTLEAVLNLFPERIERIPLGGDLRPVGLVVVDDQSNELLRWEAGAPAPSLSARRPLKPNLGAKQVLEGAMLTMSEGGDARDALQFASTDLGLRAAALTALGMLALREKRLAEAAETFEEALLYNAEDHLTWWMKAMALRLQGQEDERPELLNAHFLAPLEPALRAGAFLSQPLQGSEPSPLIKPLADNPAALIEVACLLYDCGNYADLAKWVDEALRHREIPMLRYILAAALLSETHMEVEAAEQVLRASKTPINPPYPWRETELRVLRGLLDRFPRDARLLELSAVAASE